MAQAVKALGSNPSTSKNKLEKNKDMISTVFGRIIIFD
jgi:hypothetical protein